MLCQINYYHTIPYVKNLIRDNVLIFFALCSKVIKYCTICVYNWQDLCYPNPSSGCGFPVSGLMAQMLPHCRPGLP